MCLRVAEHTRATLCMLSPRVAHPRRMYATLMPGVRLDFTLNVRKSPAPLLRIREEVRWAATLPGRMLCALGA